MHSGRHARDGVRELAHSSLALGGERTRQFARDECWHLLELTFTWQAHLFFWVGWGRAVERPNKHNGYIIVFFFFFLLNFRKLLRTWMLQHGNKKPLSQELIFGCAQLCWLTIILHENRWPLLFSLISISSTFSVNVFKKSCRVSPQTQGFRLNGTLSIRNVWAQTFPGHWERRTIARYLSKILNG